MAAGDDAHSAFSGREHTAFKHKILMNYLKPWMGILQSNNKTLVYVDCYSGPGLYPDGTKGSPLIALDIANDISSKYGCTIWCIFNDRNENICKQLRESIRMSSNSNHVMISSYQTDANVLVDSLLSDSRFAINQQFNVPMFFFIDPFGLNVPMSMLKKIMSQNKTEICVTFMIKDIVRWGSTPAYEKTMIELFNHPNPQSLISDAAGITNEQKAINAFINRLRTYALVKHVMKYRICSEQERRTLFYIVHGSNHFKGFKLMKDLMYNTGVPGTFTYMGPDQPDEGQQIIDTFESEVEHLMNYLRAKYSGEMSTYSWILEDNYAEVPYIEKHFKAALKQLQKEKYLTIRGPIGKRGGIQLGTIFDFKEA